MNVEVRRIKEALQYLDAIEIYDQYFHCDNDRGSDVPTDTD